MAQRDMQADLDKFRAIEKQTGDFEKEFDARWTGTIVAATHLPADWKGCDCKVLSGQFDYNGGAWEIFLVLAPLWEDYKGEAGRSRRDPDVADVEVKRINIKRLTTIYTDE